MFPAAHNAGERFRYPVQTKRRRRWHQARTLPVRELLRFVSTAPHSLSTGERCAQGVSARATPVVRSFPETFVAKAQLPCSGPFHTRTSVRIRNHRVQVSQTLLAEPYKYSNSRDTSSMAVYCIRSEMAVCRGIGEFPDSGRTNLGPRLGPQRSFTSFRISPAGSFLACPEQRSEARLSNGPARRRNFRDPSLRSGFRRAARTPRKRLNLLKKILASTLGVFQKCPDSSPRGSTGRGGCMGRSFDSFGFAFICIIGGLIAALTSCSSSSPTNATNFPVPAKIVLSPATEVSLDVGSPTQIFTATPQNNKGTTVTTPVSFLSSNTSVLTIASNGRACAGTWDSLTTPQICTPGPVGVVEVTATSHGISSPPTTVYVHQRIDNISISLVPGQTLPAGTCFSKGQIVNYQATALSHGLDITASAGPFNWQAVTSGVATLKIASVSAPVSGLLPGQVEVTAGTPGVTSLFASVSNVNSQPLDFTTCAVQSITLAVTGSSTNTINVTSGAGKTVTATVVDTAGNTITGVPLTWSSSQSATVGASSAGSVTTSKAGGASVIASCTPPTCNIGFQPLLPIYPESAVDVVVAPTSTTTTTATTTIYVSSTGVSASGDCSTTSGCFSTLVPITAPANTVGTAVNLPATPNSLVFDRTSTGKAYMGTDFGFLGTRGLIVVTAGTPPTVSEVKGVIGKVLTVSPDGKKVILSGTDPNTLPVSGSNTPPAPTQVTVFDTTSSTSTILPIAGATAADYSPDNLKASILAGSTLYVYSTLEALKTIALGAPANDVSFLPEGGFAYLAGGATSSITAWKTCTDAQEAAQTVTTPSTPAFIKALSKSLTVGGVTFDGSVLAVDSPGIDLFGAKTSIPVPPTGSCPLDLTNSTLDITTSSSAFFNLGQGSFVPTQLILSQDGTRAYILASNLGSVLVFNVGNQTSSAIPLSGDAIPIQASLTADGTRLYLAAADGQVHVLDTQTGGDIQQISFPTDATTLQAGLCVGTTVTCNPDLIAVKP